MSNRETETDTRALVEEAKRIDAMALRAYPILEWFSFNHLPPALQGSSRPFYELAWSYARKAYRADADCVIREPELVEGLRKLLEAKDCMVRAMKKVG